MMQQADSIGFGSLPIVLASVFFTGAALALIVYLLSGRNLMLGVAAGGVSLALLKIAGIG